jgi:hypothetical protein
MIKHFGRWVVGLMIVMAAGGWLIQRTVDETTLTRILWIIDVAGSVAVLVFVERHRGAKPGILSIVATVVAAATLAWIELELEARWWVRGLLIAVMATPLMSIANALYRADVLWAQQRRDDHATRLAQAVLAGEPVEQFALYLRPFVSTDRLMVQPLPSMINEVPVYLDVETLLARSFRGTVPVIALGQSGDTVEGAARVMVRDDNWRETVEALARRAEFIAMVPLSRPGTMWELEWLKQSELLNKVLFIMPEIPHETPSGVVSTQETDDRIFDAGVRQFDASIHMLDLPNEWREVKRVAEKFGLEFPTLAAVGALYTMDSTTGTVKAIFPLSLSTIARRIRYLRTSVMRLRLLPTSKAPLDFLDDYVKAVFWGGRTLEYALIRTADGFAVWGDGITATGIIQRGIKAEQVSAEAAGEYVNALPDLIEARVRMGDARAVVHYGDFARLVRADSLLAPLITNEALRQIDTLLKNFEIDSSLAAGEAQHQQEPG